MTTMPRRSASRTKSSSRAATSGLSFAVAGVAVQPGVRVGPAAVAPLDVDADAVHAVRGHVVQGVDVPLGDGGAVQGVAAPHAPELEFVAVQGRAVVLDREQLGRRRVGGRSGADDEGEQAEAGHAAGLRTVSRPGDCSTSPTTPAAPNRFTRLRGDDCRHLIPVGRRPAGRLSRRPAGRRPHLSLRSPACHPVERVVDARLAAVLGDVGRTHPLAVNLHVVERVLVEEEAERVAAVEVRH